MKRTLFSLAHELQHRGFSHVYHELVRNQRKPYEVLKEEQERELRQMIRFAYENVPYYHRLFKNLGASPEDIRTVEDLQHLPILTKQLIRDNWDDLKPAGLDRLAWCLQATGGSTGTPLKYRLSKYDRFLGAAIMYRGYGGYSLGDAMAVLGGASLDIGTKPLLLKLVEEVATNKKKLSSFDMGEQEMRQYVDIINAFRPKFMRGYASSIYFFSRWIEENGIRIHKPRAVFTTAEKLYPEMRETIGRVLGCEVYDTYGLNDGGVSAYECPEHCGLHIDTERAVMEVVDEAGRQISSGEGRILATSLHNTAMPFIRYDTGDIARITDRQCACGRGYRLLDEVVGRSVDMLVTPEGKSVHGWIFLYIFWECCRGVKEYQVVQEHIDTVRIKIVRGDDFDEAQLQQIRDLVRVRSPGWRIEFEFVDKIERTGAGKFKFIVSALAHRSGVSQVD